MAQVKIKSKKKIIERSKSQYNNYLIYLFLTALLMTLSIFVSELLPLYIFFVMVVIIVQTDLRYWNLVERLKK